MTPRNQKFIEKYIQIVILGGGSQSEAYRQSGYKSKNPDVDAAKLLAKPSIKAEIEKRKQEIFAKEKINTEKVLHELACIGFSNITDYLLYTEHGRVRFKKSRDLSRDQAAAISSIKINKKDGTIELKFHDKVEALELIGRNKKMFTDKLAIGGDPENPNSITVSFVPPKE